MDINNDLQQINVFNKGMNTDTSDAYMPAEQYRYAENLRFVTNDGQNSGELRLIEGYAEKYELQGNSVVAVTSIRNYIIFLVNDELDGAQVHVVDTYITDTNTNNITIPVSIKGEEWDADYYSLVTRWESDSNVKLYIADGKHELISVNITKPNNTYTKINQLVGNSEDVLRPINVEILDGGNLKCPVVLYCYVLYNDYGVVSDISSLSLLKILYNKTTAALSDYKKINGFVYGRSIDKKAKLTIHVNQQTFSRIKVFRIEYLQNYQTPSVYVIYDELAQTNNLIIEDSGLYLYEISSAELLVLTKYYFHSKYIESKNNYLFAANIEDTQGQIDSKFNDINITYEIISKLYREHATGFVHEEDIQNYGPSLMIGETYRYGIVYYLQDGTKSSVHHIADITLSESDYSCCNLVSPVYYFNRFGVKFTINGTIPEDCVGYEIVRCERTLEDSSIITQGIIGSTYGFDNSNLRWSSCLMTMQKRDEGAQFKSQTDLLMFASPESSYQMDDVMLALNKYDNSLYIELNVTYNIPICYVEPDLYTSQYPYMNSVKFFNYINMQETYSPIGLLTTYGYVPSNWWIRDTPVRWKQQNHHTYGGDDSYVYLNYVNVFKKTNDTKWRVDIDEYTNVNSPSPNNFNDGDTVTIDKDITAIGSKGYLNWDAAPLIVDGELDVNKLDILTFSKNNPGLYNITAGKKCILIKPSTVVQQYPDNIQFYINDPDTGEQIVEGSNIYTHILTEPFAFLKDIAPITVVNIKKRGSVPYKGTTASSKENNVYYSFGNYSDISNLEIEVYDGDVYSGMFIYNSSHAFISDRYHWQMFPVIYAVPLQSRIDLLGRYGDLYVDMYNNLYGYMFQDESGKFGGLVQEKDAYMYNTTYSLLNTLISKYSLNLSRDEEYKYDTRIHYSEPKTNGELIDSWTKFKALNFTDVDTRYGEITGLKLFKDILVYWLNNATGVLAVNERTIILDSNSANIILGNGDVLQRYDYLSTKYGMIANQMCTTQSDNALYWWDEHNKDIVMYAGGQLVQPMKIAKTINNLINTKTISNPCMAYDNKYKEVLLSTVEDDEKEQTLAYSELIQQFVSLYNIKFNFSASVDDKLFLITDRVYLWNENDLSNTDNMQPVLQYVVNDKSALSKVYDNVRLGLGWNYYKNQSDIKFDFETFNQSSEFTGSVSNIENDSRLAIPRAGNAKYGDRMRGRTMRCKLSLLRYNCDFSILYIITKYRISFN